MYLGSAWYPEQWPEERWKRDLELMQAAGMNVARIGEYTWSRLEPVEGRLELDWLERAVDLAAEYGVHVVMGTPTDAPPAWLTKKYPEVLRVEADGRATTHGARRHFSPFSPRYRDLCAGIVSAMADRFGRNPNVLGWQIGNEFCMSTYDELTHRLFQKWLEKRYGTLENLNRKWTTHYWSEAYSDWSEIPLPSGWPHPGLDLEFFRFMSEGFAEFQRVQIDIIRKVAGDTQWITHNAHGWEDLDFTRILEDVDVASWDPYPGGGPLNYQHFGFYSDFCRTMKNRQHWIIETQPGHVNWSSPNLSLARGALRAMAWHFYAHGAEAVLFWQWRSALNGQEQYHGTVLAADGEPRAIYPQIAQVGREVRQVGPLLESAKAQASVGLLYSYADQVVIKRQRHHHDFDPLKHTMECYAPLRAMAIEVNVLDARREIDGYPLIVAPHLHIHDESLVRKLVRYVKGGGHLLLGPRSGFKDEYNAMLPSRQPGAELAELLGAQVEEFHTLDRPVEVSGEIGIGQAKIWAEYFTVQAPDTQVLLKYAKFNGWIDDQPAMVTRQVGKGRISYLGTWLEPAGMRMVMEWAARISEIARPFPAPPAEVEVCTRINNGRELFIFINHSGSIQELTLPRAMHHALAGSSLPVEEVVLQPYDVAVLV